MLKFRLKNFVIHRLSNGLAGHDDFEEAKVDAIADFFKDLRTEQEPYVFARMGWAVDGVGDWKGTKEDMEDLRKNCFLQAVEKHFPVFLEILKESKSGYLVNSGLTWVDFFVAEYLFTIQCLEPEIAKQHPQLFEYMKKVYSLPTITDYVATREHENW
uniref:glutathione transferase n=1 Tax=Acrobeloides nanus TaxID=290746 RepID=A0A914E7W2_9BILA